VHEALFYERQGGNQVRCHLCRFRCLIQDGARGHCQVRENRSGTLYSLTYGQLCALAIDPIEKKPLFHVMPGSTSFSLAAPGCNFRCRHCQNAAISQAGAGMTVRGVEVSPAEVVERALAAGCPSLSYTYTEPTVFYEFAQDTARLAHQAGLRNIFVSNGYITPEALGAIAPWLDAANIDLKGFSETFYRNIVQARLSEVLDSLIEYRRLGIWLEVTTLLIPGLNDADAELEGLASFITSHLGADTPWHVSQFHPTYLLTDRPRTPLATLRRAREIGLAAGLHYVYEGNAQGEGGEDTHCPRCQALLIKRLGFTIVSNRLQQGGCPDCGAAIAGIALSAQ